MSLSPLWQRQGKGAAARQLLADVYGWFTEGFDTADLQEAKALLEEFSIRRKDAWRSIGYSVRSCFFLHFDHNCGHHGAHTTLPSHL